MTKQRGRAVTWQGVMGRWSIFPDTNGGQRFQGVLTKEGGREFEKQRKRLRLVCREVMGRAPTRVSDANTVEFLARGELPTRTYLKMQKDDGAGPVWSSGFWPW